MGLMKRQSGTERSTDMGLINFLQTGTERSTDMELINYLQNYIKQEYKPEDLDDKYYQIKWECVCWLAGYSMVFPDEKMSPDEMKVIIDNAFEKILDKIW